DVADADAGRAFVSGGRDGGDRKAGQQGQAQQDGSHRYLQRCLTLPGERTSPRAKLAAAASRNPEQGGGVCVLTRATEGACSKTTSALPVSHNFTAWTWSARRLPNRPAVGEERISLAGR